MNFTWLAAASGMAWLALAPATAWAQTFELGQTVEGCGFKGPIVEIKPRAGWDVPFYVIRHHSSSTYYDINCTPEQMRLVAEPGPAAPVASRRQNSPATRPESQPMGALAAPAAGGLCRPGAKLEALYGNSWYEVTVLGGLDAEGKCPIGYDGYGRMWDESKSPDQLRPRGGGYVYKPKSPVAREPARSPTQATGIRDGRYTCHKISPGGGFHHIGYLTISGGRGTLLGGLAGWKDVSIEPMANSPRGKPMVAYYYRSAAGWNDKLDCELQ